MPDASKIVEEVILNQWAGKVPLTKKPKPAPKSSAKASSTPKVPTAAPKRQGRPRNALNYTAEEDQKILDLIGHHLPGGPVVWDLVVKEYNAWAESKGYPQHLNDGF
jgi:hypothetical protein